ncbi:deoxyribonuclease [Helicobacter saguini]|uniref:Deoxyribonuclease n=1 Tax=Helicobacter saguini TaxID=1548018 RepID=A0A347W5Z8_9HELI|nr:endonuclease [Helicobacter saguini]MWV61224.1 deoxyribonuclease [Helicobacter saguini]MWV68109.1 deoxyribonuclease [Helicobacter saguini]MWV70427.1 deoxyribonuclease [Helicobacter saguini]MWV72328.1 deoxyribonuclease [Helicobacter saguini]TLD92980.1 deoxyribonuclease [Helicobacter saguini]
MRLRKKLTFSTFLLLIFACIYFLYLYQTATPKDFKEAKKILKKAWKMQDFTHDFYCNAPFEITQNGLKVIESSVYSPRKKYTKKGAINERAKVIEFEHIMPAHNFGQHLACWRRGGRAACKEDAKFNAMEADLQNLVPAIGEINGDRNNFRYAQAPRDLAYTQYGGCQVFSDFKARRFYPAEYSKGLIARTYLYMSEKYDINLSDSERKLMESWDKMYPPNDYEKARNAAIQKAKILYAFTKIKEIF